MTLGKWLKGLHKDTYILLKKRGMCSFIPYDEQYDAWHIDSVDTHYVKDGKWLTYDIPDVFEKVDCYVIWKG